MSATVPETDVLCGISGLEYAKVEAGGQMPYLQALVTSRPNVFAGGDATSDVDAPVFR